MVISAYSVWLVNLNPTKGHEISKMRPCVVVSPDSMNRTIQTLLIAPLTSTIRAFPFRADCIFQEKQGQVALDQMRCVDKVRFVRKLGQLSEKESQQVSEILVEMFAWE